MYMHIYIFHAFIIKIKKIESQIVKFAKALLFSDWCIIVCHFNEQNHRMREWLESKGISGGHLVQHLFSSRATCSRLLESMLRPFFNISEEGKRRCFLMFIWFLP